MRKDAARQEWCMRHVANVRALLRPQIGEFVLPQSLTVAVPSRLTYCDAGRSENVSLQDARLSCAGSQVPINIRRFVG